MRGPRGMPDGRLAGGDAADVMLKIDLHTHILPREWPSWTQRTGYAGWIELEHHAPGCARMVRVGEHGERQVFRQVGANCWDPAVRLAECDAAGVHVQVLSTVPVMFSYWARAGDAYDLSRLLNDHIADVCRQYPTRFAGLGTIPLQDTALAVRELERCVRDLGLAGVQIGTHVNGDNLDEPRLLPVFEAAGALGAAVFVHPWGMMARERMERYWLAWLVGMPAETCLAVCSVLMGGVLERVPTLRIGFAHAGGSFPGTVGRIEHGFHARPDLCATRTSRPPREYLADAVTGRSAAFFVDSLTHDPEMLRRVIALFGVRRVALGSDYPFPLGESRPGAMIEALEGLTAEDRAWLLGRTALEFLGMPAERFAPPGGPSRSADAGRVCGAATAGMGGGPQP